jgi:hypothetical protein
MLNGAVAVGVGVDVEVATASERDNRLVLIVGRGISSAFIPDTPVSDNERRTSANCSLPTGTIGPPMHL